MSEHLIDKHAGKRLRLRRTILGMSQDVLGNAVGVTFQQIQKYERGINRMSASRMFLIAKKLEVPVNYFFEGLEDHADYVDCPSNHLAEKRTGDNMTDEEHEELTTRETLELARAYHKIKAPNVRKQIFELVKALGKHGG
ncbi:MAG: helix-turn-helix domain-containing protein [Aliifodinibius sp.]|nr:helix-turn-helix domain-containing protein [Fodinibius sp.]NIW80953.1 helix-turn-helix domain-containing protein [Calditrichia bacterium]